MSTNNYIKYDFPDAKSVVVSGDIHVDFTQLVYKCCIQYSMTDTVIIVAGDCGFGFEKPGYYENLYKRCRERLSKANNWLLFVRGNQEIRPISARLCRLARPRISSPSSTGGG